MFNKYMPTAFAAIALCFSASSHAGLIVDVVGVNKYLSTWGNTSTSWTHNLIDDGFIPGSATNGKLHIDFQDDKERWWYWEAAAVKVGDSWTWDDSYWHWADDDYSTFLDFASIDLINTNGFLDVKVKANYGDFYIRNSYLKIKTKDPISSVPEPGSLALLALGLLGLGLQRKRTW